MKTSTSYLFIAGTLVSALSACGDGGPLPSVNPGVNITSPANNSTVNLPVNKMVSVNFETNYTLKTPGTCGGQDNCGHIYLLIDNTNCDLQNLPYNSLVVSSPAQADFGKCGMPTGMHTLRLELHADNSSQVLNAVGNPVVSEVTVTAQ